MSLQDAAEFVLMFKLPLLCAAFSLAGAVLGMAFRDDSPRADWPAEDWRGQ